MTKCLKIKLSGACHKWKNCRKLDELLSRAGINNNAFKITSWIISIFSLLSSLSEETWGLPIPSGGKTIVYSLAVTSVTQSSSSSTWLKGRPSSLSTIKPKSPATPGASSVLPLKTQLIARLQDCGRKSTTSPQTWVGTNWNQICWMLLGDSLLIASLSVCRC